MIYLLLAMKDNGPAWEQARHTYIALAIVWLLVSIVSVIRLELTVDLRWLYPLLGGLGLSCFFGVLAGLTLF